MICGRSMNNRDVQFYTIVVIALFFPFFCCSAGIYYTQFFDTCVSCIPVPFVALMELYVFVYFFELDKLENEVIKYTGKKIPSFIKWLLKSKYLIIVLSIILLFGIYDQITLLSSYGAEKLIFGWFLSLYPIVLGFGYFFYHRSSEYNL